MQNRVILIKCHFHLYFGLLCTIIFKGYYHRLKKKEEKKMRERKEERKVRKSFKLFRVLDRLG